MQKYLLRHFQDRIKQKAVKLSLNFEIPTEILEAGLVITDLYLTDLKYNKNWEFRGGTLDALAVEMANYQPLEE